MSLFDLTGKVAVVTGSTKGIGKAIAEELSVHGAKVIITSRKATACDAVAQKIRKTGGEAMAIPCNVSHKDQLEFLSPRRIELTGELIFSYATPLSILISARRSRFRIARSIRSWTSI